MMMMAATMLTAASCSDFDDYNEVPSASSQAGDNLSLWENISRNAELSDFRALVERTGFHKNLQQDRSYTVWAPQNGFTGLADYQAMSDSLLLEHFVKNHIAEYKFMASGKVDNQRIHMLNNKSLVFNGDGNYQFSGVDVAKANVPSLNGVMHVLSNSIQFYPNLYEYIKMADTIGMLRNQIMKYEVTALDYDKSEKGPIVNGVQTYIDSVMVTSNSILKSGLRAYIDREDSAYTMIMPTNAAFTDYISRVAKLYNYIAEVKCHDVAKYEKPADTKEKSATVAGSLSELRDSIARKSLITNLVYSHTFDYNKGMKDDTALDTIFSTGYHFLSNGDEIVRDHTIIGPVEMSNGFARIVDTLAFHPWETYNPQINSRNLLRAFNNTKANARSEAVPMKVRTPGWSLFDPEYGIDEFTYQLVEPQIVDKSKPEMFYSLPDVLSGKYRIYCVFLPAWTGNTGANLPTAMNFQLRYCDEKGKLQTYNFCANPDDANHKAQEGGTWQDNPKTLNMATAFQNDTNLVNKADTIYLGEFEFKICYKDLENNVAPSIYVSSPLSVFNKTQMANYSREFRFWAFIARPVDYDDYLKSKKSNDNE